MTARFSRAKDEEGVALLIAVILLLMISALGLTALQSAQDEATGSGGSRRKTANLMAAVSALELVEQNLDVENTQYPNTLPIDLPSFMTDQWGGDTAVRTGTVDSVSPQPIRKISSVASQGDQMNLGSANSMSQGIYRADIVATDPGGGMVQVQAQYRISEGAVGYQ